MTKKVISFIEWVRAMKRRAFNRSPPKFRKQRLTEKLVRELMKESHLYNLMAAFADEQYHEFLEYVATRHPELMRAWIWKTLKYSPELRRRLFAEGKRTNER